MRLSRTIGVLSAIAVMLLTVVVMRGEVARLHYDMSRFDQRIDAMKLQFRENELEIARLRNPSRVAARAAAVRMGQAGRGDAAAPGTSPPRKPNAGAPEGGGRTGD